MHRRLSSSGLIADIPVHSTQDRWHRRTTVLFTNEWGGLQGKRALIAVSSTTMATTSVKQPRVWDTVEM